MRMNLSSTFVTEFLEQLSEEGATAVTNVDDKYLEQLSEEGAICVCNCSCSLRSQMLDAF